MSERGGSRGVLPVAARPPVDGQDSTFRVAVMPEPMMASISDSVASRSASSNEFAVSSSSCLYLFALTFDVFPAYTCLDGASARNRTSEC